MISDRNFYFIKPPLHLILQCSSSDIPLCNYSQHHEFVHKMFPHLLFIFWLKWIAEYSYLRAIRIENSRIYLSVTSILTEYKETLFKVFLRFIMRVLPLRVATAFLMRNKLKISQTNMFVIYSKQSHFICDLKTENYSGFLSFGFSLAALNILRRIVRLFKIKKDAKWIVVGMDWMWCCRDCC